MEKGVKRWYVDISQWNPSHHDFHSAMYLLPKHEHSSITRYVKMEDRKRALGSRLLQYALVHEVLGIPFDAIVIKRTPEGKPYLDHDKVNLEFPNFNFNASHHGDYVAVASEPLCLVGLDIVSHAIPEKETIPDFIGNFKSYFSSLEWNSIMKGGTCDEILSEFYRYWCLKEAFVKATGTGLAYNLDKVEFHHTSWTNISVKIGGEYKRDWRFWLLELGSRHWVSFPRRKGVTIRVNCIMVQLQNATNVVSIARGHPRSATESYKQTLKRTDFSEEEYCKGLNLPNVGFTSRTIGELVSLMESTLQHNRIQDMSEVEVTVE